jgi:uncharacterized phage protein (TIGR01671 family)
MTIQRAGGEKIMREIKFRAWDSVSKKMVYFELNGRNPNAFVDSGYIYLRFPTSIANISAHGIKLMQYTGLHDKNGKEIYEGDICKYWMDSVWKHGYVFWSQGGFALKVFRMGEKTVDVVFKFQAFIPVPDDGETMTDQFEVIGNIYDNPELLEGVAG